MTATIEADEIRNTEPTTGGAPEEPGTDDFLTQQAKELELHTPVDTRAADQWNRENPGKVQGRVIFAFIEETFEDGSVGISARKRRDVNDATLLGALALQVGQLILSHNAEVLARFMPPVQAIELSLEQAIAMGLAPADAVGEVGTDETQGSDDEGGTYNPATSQG